MDQQIKNSIYKFGWPLVLIAVLAVVFLVPASRRVVFDFFNLSGQGVEEGIYYTCPMHPEIRLPQMGDCPICGMSLVEKAAIEEESTGLISVTPQQVQLSGVTVEPLKKRRLVKEIDTFGKIDYDETQLGVVSAWVGGRIDELFVDFTGVTVNKGHPLVYLYSPDLISTEGEFLLAIENLKKVEKSGLDEAIAGARGLVDASRQRLLRWGLGEAQIERIARSKKIEDHVIIYAPRGGTVIQKNAYKGMYVKEGDILFRIADLSKVWLYADIYEGDIPFLYEKRPDDFYECPMHPDITSKSPETCSKCGMDLIRTNKSIEVEITARACPGEVFKGAISFTDPFMNPETRTVRVRVNIDNPELKLKPDMYARAKITLPAGEKLAVPESAVIHSGQRNIVLIEEDDGKFKPRLVRLGRMWINEAGREEAEQKELIFQRGSLRYHEVIAGAVEGDRVVTSGNFLLGSESKLQGALAKMLGSGDAEAAPPDAPVSHPHHENRDGQESDKKHIHPGAKDKAGEKMEAYIFTEEKAFDKILESYLLIASRLARDKTEGISALADTIKTKAASKSIQKAADPLRHAHHKKDIEEVRNDFVGLSHALVAYIEQYKSKIKDIPYKAYCPMKKANWIQNQKEIENPYYGSAMFRCGEIQPWDK